MKASTYGRLSASVALGVALWACATPSRAARTVDRLYLFGDDSRETATDGAFVNSTNKAAPFARRETIDSAGTVGAGQQVVNLQTSPFGTNRVPTYAAVNDRPDGVSGFGLRFDGSRQDNIRGPRFGTPETSISGVQMGGSTDYFFILDRGMQFWTKPTALPTSEDAHIVMDTNNHGALINTDGQFAMRYSGEDYAGVGFDASVDEWYHVMVVRPDRTNPASVMYVNGVAVAAAEGDYARGIRRWGRSTTTPTRRRWSLAAARIPSRRRTKA